MAHHLADVMAAAKADPAKGEECKNLILELWRQRRFFPAGDPFERYTKLLSALEAHLQVHPEYLHIRGFGMKQQSKEEQDWGTLAQSIRSQVGWLLSLMARFGAEGEGLGKDDLIGIANTADPDDQSRLLSVMRVVLSSGDGGDESTGLPDPVLEALDDLENHLVTYRALYQSRASYTARGE